MKFPYLEALLQLLLVAFLSAAMFAAPSWAEPATGKRVALVIGNSAYVAAPPLKNPRSDARLMASTLTRAGFTVKLLQDASQAEMKRALLEFGRSLRQEGIEAGLFYYAGHGVQIRGENFLIPVSAAIRDEDEVDLEGIDINDFLQTMNSSKSQVNIVILDACRNNPFARSFRSDSRGLAPVEAPKGTFIAYATSPGRVALDGDNDVNSPYTAALSKAIDEPGLNLEAVFKTARRAVFEATKEAQIPWEESSIVGDFYFHPKQTEDDEALALWKVVQHSTVAADYHSFIERFGGKSPFLASLAQERLKELVPPDKLQPAELQPAPAAASTPDPIELRRNVQSALRMTGCYQGAVDGKWGENSRAAVKAFSQNAQVRVASLEPSPDLLGILAPFKSRVCPLTCAPTQRIVDGKCVAKPVTSPRQPSPAKKQAAQGRKDAVKPARKAKPARQNCFSFDGETFCE